MRNHGAFHPEGCCVALCAGGSDDDSIFSRVAMAPSYYYRDDMEGGQIERLKREKCIAAAPLPTLVAFILHLTDSSLTHAIITSAASSDGGRQSRASFNSSHLSSGSNSPEDVVLDDGRCAID